MASGTSRAHPDPTPRRGQGQDGGAKPWNNRPGVGRACRAIY
jgi:hypothetical protein